MQFIADCNLDLSLGDWLLCGITAILSALVALLWQSKTKDMQELKERKRRGQREQGSSLIDLISESVAMMLAGACWSLAGITSVVFVGNSIRILWSSLSQGFGLLSQGVQYGLDQISSLEFPSMPEFHFTMLQVDMGPRNPQVTQTMEQVTALETPIQPLTQATIQATQTAKPFTWFTVPRPIEEEKSIISEFYRTVGQR